MFILCLFLKIVESKFVLILLYTIKSLLVLVLSPNSRYRLYKNPRLLDLSFQASRNILCIIVLVIAFLRPSMFTSVPFLPLPCAIDIARICCVFKVKVPEVYFNVLRKYADSARDTIIIQEFRTILNSINKIFNINEPLIV